MKQKKSINQKLKTYRRANVVTSADGIRDVLPEFSTDSRAAKPSPASESEKPASTSLAVILQTSLLRSVSGNMTVPYNNGKTDSAEPAAGVTI